MLYTGENQQNMRKAAQSIVFLWMKTHHHLVNEQALAKNRVNLVLNIPCYEVLVINVCSKSDN